MPRKKKSDTEVLFPEQTFDFSIGKVTIKPFTFGELIDITPSLEQLVDELKQQGILFNVETLSITFSEVLTYYFVSAPFLIPIMSVASKRTEEELRELNPVEAINMVLGIIAQNAKVIESFFVLFSPAKSTQLIQEKEAEGKVEVQNQEIT